MLRASASRRWGGGGGEGVAKVHEHLFFINNSDNLKWQTAFHISKCQWKTDGIIFTSQKLGTKGKNIYYDTADSKKLVVRLKESNLFSCYDKINRGELNRCSFIILYLTQKTLVVASSCRSNNATRDHIEWRHLRMHRGWWLYWHTRKTLPSATLKMSSRRKEHHLPVKWNEKLKLFVNGLAVLLLVWQVIMGYHFSHTQLTCRKDVFFCVY